MKIIKIFGEIIEISCLLFLLIVCMLIFIKSYSISLPGVVIALPVINYMSISVWSILFSIGYCLKKIPVDYDTYIISESESENKINDSDGSPI